MGQRQLNSVFTFKRYLHAVATVVMLASLFACGKKGEEVVSECVLEADQAASIKGHWSNRPVPIGVVANGFSGTENIIIGQAVDVWNNFFESSRGYSIFEKNGTPIQQISGGSNFTASSVGMSPIVSGTSFTGTVMIHKRTSWSGGPYSSSAIALSSVSAVPVSGTQYKVIINAVMEVNYKDYFASGKPNPDFRTIILHELGHIIGLDHSCGAAGIIQCSSSTPQEYLQAVMFPAPTAGNGVRHALQVNDKYRANCAYGASSN